MVTERQNPKPVYKKGEKLPQTTKPLNFKPEPFFPKDWYHHNYAGKRRCLSWAPTSGSQCNAAAMRGRLNCRKHGGKTPVGVAASAYKTGRYSKYVPARMLSSYKASLNDPDLLEVRSDIALLDARLADLLSRVDNGESGHLLKEARDAFNLLKSAMQRRDADQTVVAMTTLDEKLNRGVADYAAWDEIYQVMGKRERAGEREMNRLVAMNQTMTVERALELIHTIGDIIRRHVQDRETLLRISAEIAYLIDHPGEQLPPTAEKGDE
jgi:hypothetical protein